MNKINKFLVAILVVLLGVGGFLFGSQRSQASQYQEKTLSLPVENVVTNLSDGHYVRVSLVLEYANPEATPFLTEAVYKVKAAIIQEIRLKKAADLQDMELFKKELKTLINEAVKPWKITDIYITELIIQ